MCWTLYIREFKREESKSMILADKTIRELNSKNEITIEPIGEKTIQPASVDLSLGTSWSQPIVRSNGRAKLTELSEADNWSWHDEKMLITPGAFVLATTRERVRLPANVAGMISGRSSVGRAGLFVENAGYVDPGFDGHITLELYNASPNTIEIEAGTRVAQLILIQMDGAAAEPYSGKYNGQTDATPSKMAEDKDTIKADHDPIRGTFVSPDFEDHDYSKDSTRTVRDYCKTQDDCIVKGIGSIHKCRYFDDDSRTCVAGLTLIEKDAELLNDKECDCIDVARGLKQISETTSETDEAFKDLNDAIAVVSDTLTALRDDLSGALEMLCDWLLDAGEKLVSELEEFFHIKPDESDRLSFRIDRVTKAIDKFKAEQDAGAEYPAYLLNSAIPSVNRCTLDAGAEYPAYLCKTEGELSGPEHFFDHMEPDYLSFRDPARKIRDYCKDRVWCFDNKSICKYFINRKCILRNYIKGGCNPCDLYSWECEIIDKARGLKE